MYAAGVRIAVVEGGRLRLTGEPCPPELKAELVAHRAAVLAELQRQRIGAGEGPYTFTWAVPCETRACRHLGPCGHFLTHRPCGVPMPARDALEESPS